MRGVMFGVGGYVFIEGATDDMIFIATQTASNSTAIDFVNGSGGVVFDSTYKAYALVLTSVKPVTDTARPILRTSSNAGSSYDTGASDYAFWTGGGNADTTANANNNSAADDGIYIGSTDGCGNATGEHLSGIIYMFNPAGTDRFLTKHDIAMVPPDGVPWFGNGGGMRAANADVDAIRFLYSTGNISSGTFTLYGLKDS
jgi:hypothetical protein